MRALTLALLLATAALAAPPARIVSTAPSLTETLFALGLGNRVVGVTEFCRYPPEAAAKPKIGTFLEPNLERILALKPDLVLVVRNPVQLAEKLQRLGLRAVEIPQETVAEIIASIREIGRLTGAEAQARLVASRVEAELDAVRRRAAGLPRKKVLFLIGRSPGTLQGMVGVGGGNFLDELIRLAGGENVLASSPIPYPRVSMEQILAADPDVILDMGDFAHHEGRPMESVREFLGLWSAYPVLRAVRQGAVRQVDSEVLIRPGPRVGEAARRMLALVHGVRVQ
ncbi:MAG: ABC transporter substrate-binding protein [Bryobacteraceae bacterium]